MKIAIVRCFFLPCETRSLVPKYLPLFRINVFHGLVLACITVEANLVNCLEESQLPSKRARINAQDSLLSCNIDYILLLFKPDE